MTLPEARAAVHGASKSPAVLVGPNSVGSSLSVLRPHLELDSKVEVIGRHGRRYKFSSETNAIGIRHAGSRGDDPDARVEPSYQEINPDGTLGPLQSGIPTVEGGDEPPSTIDYDVITGDEPHTGPLSPNVQNMPNIWELLTEE